MKHYYLALIISILSCFHAKCQETEKNELSEEIVYSSKTVDSISTFIGGNDLLHSWLSDNIKFPEDNLEKYAKTNRLTTYFIVEKDGSISNVKTYSIHEDLKNLVEQSLINMPNWLPATVDNKAVRCQVIIPITFTVNEEGKRK